MSSVGLYEGVITEAELLELSQDEMEKIANGSC
jgi:hypothetical protein